MNIPSFFNETPNGIKWRHRGGWVNEQTGETFVNITLSSRYWIAIPNLDQFDENVNEKIDKYLDENYVNDD